MRYFKAIGWFIFFVAFVTFNNIGFIQQSLRPDPVTYDNQPFATEYPVYYQGDIFRFHVERCVHVDRSVAISSIRHFVNVHTEEFYTVEIDFRIIHPGCYRGLSSIPTHFPDAMPTGVYRFEGISVTRVGSQSDENFWTTAEFTYLKTRGEKFP